MAISIISRISLTDEHECALREMIDIGFKALHIANLSTLKIPYAHNLKKIALLAIETLGVAYQAPDSTMTEAQAEALINVFEGDDHACIIRHAFDVYRFANYPPTYPIFLKCLQLVIGLGSTAVIQSQLQLSLSQYSQSLHKIPPLNRDLWEAIFWEPLSLSNNGNGAEIITKGDIKSE